MFVTDDRVVVSDDSGNSISIVAKMNLKQKQQVTDALFDVQIQDGKQTSVMQVGRGQLALLRQNIVGWSGPAFVGVKCTQATIDTLDPDEPLVIKVLEEIQRRNLSRHETSDPNAPSADG